MVRMVQTKEEPTKLCEADAHIIFFSVLAEVCPYILLNDTYNLISSAFETCIRTLLFCVLFVSFPVSHPHTFPPHLPPISF